jgi:hypothetical protein
MRTGVLWTGVAIRTKEWGGYEDWVIIRTGVDMRTWVLLGLGVVIRTGVAMRTGFLMRMGCYVFNTPSQRCYPGSLLDLFVLMYYHYFIIYSLFCMYLFYYLFIRLWLYCIHSAPRVPQGFQQSLCNPNNPR